MTSDAADLLLFAREDFSAAQQMLAHAVGLPRHVCGHAQQTAEKAIKAALIEERVLPPYRHDLVLLADLLAPSLPLPVIRADLQFLTTFALRSRYPDDLPNAGPDDARDAVRIAGAVLEAVEAHLARR